LDSLKLVGIGLFTLGVSLGLACQADRANTSTSERLDGAARAPKLPASALQVQPEQLSRIELSGGRGRAQPIVLAKNERGWQVLSPIAYRANQTAIEAMVAVLAEIEILERAGADATAARKYGVQAGGLRVKAWAGDQPKSHFVIGHSSREQTYGKPVGGAQILTVRGRCGPIFNKTLDELRHPIITDLDEKQIAGVRYENRHGVLELVADPAGGFVPKKAHIPNFNRQRARKQVGVLAHLFAKGFVDRPFDRQRTGLFNDDTARATLLLSADGAKSIDVWVGARTKDGHVHLRTSQPDQNQIYLVSGHLESSLVPRRRYLERSDEMMRQLRGKKDELARAGTKAHTHDPRPVASEVPPELMNALRALAHEQRGKP